MIGSLFKLTGKTRKGKNRVRERGETWRLAEERDTVQFAPGKAGPWLLLDPVTAPRHCDHPDCTILSDHSRWVHRNDDPDFTVEEIPQ